MSRACATLLIAMLCACSQTSRSGWGAPHELRIGIVSDPSSLNPLFVTSQNAVDMGQLYTETLVGLSPQNRLVPLLAQRIPSRANGGISADGLTITYRLRRDERFADGVPLTSKDVAFTYRVILDPRNPVTAAEPYRAIASLATPDAFTVRIRLKHPWAAAVSELFAESDYAFGILPEHAFGGSTDLSRAAWNQKPFGSGPFKVAEWRKGEQIVFVPNPYARRKPRLRRLVFKILPDANTLFVELRTHAIDVAGLTDGQVARPEALRGIRVLRSAQNHTDFLEFQTRRAPTDDVRVRLALIEGIDRPTLTKKVYRGLYPIATTEVPPSLWAHDTSIANPPYDPRRASADLDRAGWRLSHGVRFRRGQPLSLQFAFIGTSQDTRALATSVQSNLAAIGVPVVLRSYPSTIYFAPGSEGGIERGGGFNIAFSDWFGGADPEQSETYRCADLAPRGPNSARWCDPRYDAAYAAQARTTDRAARLHAFFAIQRLVHENAIADFLVYPYAFTGLNPRVRGYAPNMLFADENAEDWDV